MDVLTELVSVVIPTRNYATFIEPCIASILAQTYKHLELIVVDDCSTDDTVLVAEAALARKGSHISRAELISLNSWRGKLGALNEAFKLTRGSYVVIFDADDIMGPQFVEKSLRCIRSARALNSLIGFVYPDAILINEVGVQIGAGRAGTFCPERLRSQSYIPDCGLTDIRAIYDVLPFDEDIRVGTKHHKWKRIVERGWVGEHLDESLFQYRMHGRNLSGIGARIKPDLVLGHELSEYWTL